MATTDANKPHFTFEAKQLAADTFEVTEFSGEDAISRLFRFQIDLVSRDPDIKFDDVVNKPATFMLKRGLDETPYHGIVARFEQLGKAGDWYGYRAMLVPRLWLLSLNYQCRVFQNQTVDGIIGQVLEESGFLTRSDFMIDIVSRPEREYCVQYNETDLDFISRLLEFEGIHYYFQHDTKDVLIITDRLSGHDAISGDSTVMYNPGGGLVPGVDSVREFVCHERVVTGTFMVRDYHYEEPESFVSAESKINTRMPGRRYEFGGGLLEHSDGERIAEVRNQEAECRRRTFTGTGDCSRLVAGREFSLDKHFRSDLNGKYLVTEVRHRGSQKESIEGASPAEKAAGSKSGETYGNTFTCIPADVQFRPVRVTSIPRIHGIISAKVESGGGSQYAYLDEQGRYRVRMPFDVGDAGEGSASLPIPHAQINSGQEYGVHFPLHERNDLLLAFLDGDINRPFAVGSLPNSTNTTPVTADNNAQNVVRTMAGNEMVMDDTQDKTQIWLKTALGHEFKMDDDLDRVTLTTTEKHQVSFDDAGRFIEIKTKDGHFTRLDDKDQKITVQSKDGHRISINDKDKLITLVDESGENLFQIDIGNKQLTIKSANGGIELLAPNGKIDVKAKSVNIESTAETTMKASSTVTIQASTDLKAKAAANMTLEAGTDFKQKGLNVTSEAAVGHTIKGMQVKSEGAATNDVQGAMVSVKATGINTIQGSLVKIN
ncbi:MAG TPA: type VI secretion system tip protein TssI/VgrG [Rhodothermales bacterium]